MRYGQTIIYDSEHDEAIGTFPSQNTVVVFAGDDGRVKRTIDTAALGLRQPRGIVLHPNGTHYSVSGYWQDIYAFRRGSHELDRDLCRYETLFGHSHCSVA